MPDPAAWLSGNPAVHLTSPFMDPAPAKGGDPGPLHAARVEVFLAALAVHEAFLLRSAKRVRSNLHIAFNLLRRNVPHRPPGMATAAWQTLFLICPVLSTTFASFARLFSDLGAEERLAARGRGGSGDPAVSGRRDLAQQARPVHR
jgi:hypothetical protein